MCTAVYSEPASPMRHFCLLASGGFVGAGSPRRRLERRRPTGRPCSPEQFQPVINPANTSIMNASVTEHTAGQRHVGEVRHRRDVGGHRGEITLEEICYPDVARVRSVVVRTVRARVTPGQPWAAMIRSTVQRATVSAVTVEVGPHFPGTVQGLRNLACRFTRRCRLRVIDPGQDLGDGDVPQCPLRDRTGLVSMVGPRCDLPAVGAERPADRHDRRRCACVHR